MLFVFGYRAKKLRTNKISHLIHKSEQYPHWQFWSVSVYFQEIIDYVDDESKYDPITGTQFVISRIGFKDNKSKYYRNSDEWNLVDIVKMLREKGIDLEHNRFLILQGEVEMIAQMNPKGTNSKEIGFLEFLEEIIGSNKYVEQINYLTKTIEEFSEQKVEKNNTLKILEKGVKTLEKEKNFAIQYIRKEEQYYKLRHIFLWSEKGEASQQMDKVTIKVEETKNQLSNLDDEVKKKSDIYKELIAEIKKTMEEFKVCDGYWNKLDEQFREYEREDIRKREDLKHHLEIEDRLKSDIQKFKERKESNITTLQELKENLPKYEIEYAEISRAKDEKRVILNDIEKKIEKKTMELRNKKKEYEDQLRPKELEYVKIKDEKAAIKIERDTILKRRDGYIDEKERVDKRRKEFIEKLNQAKQNILEVNAKEEINNQQITELKENVKDLEAKINEVKLKMNKKTEVLEVAKARLSDQAKWNVIIQKLFEAQSKGKLRGIKGRLGNLGSINSRYDVAISTWCPLLDAIVVETVDDGTNCMEFLRAHKIGQGNFLWLDKIREGQRKYMNDEFSWPQNSQRLFDLVQTSNEFKEAFYYALKDTLVCDRLEYATKIGYGKKVRHRVVTLEGELIESSGTLSGGGKPRKGMMNLQTSSSNIDGSIEYTPEQVQHLESEIYKLKNDYKMLKSEMAKTVNQLSIWEDKIDKRTFESIRAKDEINEKTYQSEIQKIEQSIKNYDEILDNEDEKVIIEELNDQIINLESKLDALIPDIEDLTQKIKQKEEDILEVGGDNYRRIKEDFQILTEKELKSQTLINKTKGNIEFTTREIEQFSVTLDEKQKDIQLNWEKITFLKDELASLDTKASDVLAQFESAKSKKEEISKALEGRKEDFDEKKRSLDKLEAEKRDLTDKLNDTIQKKKRLQETIQMKDDKIKENIKEYKRIKIDYTFFNYLDELERGELPSYVMNGDDTGPQRQTDISAEIEYTRSEKRGQNSWEYYLNWCELGVNLTLPQWEYIGEQKMQIYEWLKEYEMELQKMRPNIQSIEEFKNKLKKI